MSKTKKASNSHYEILFIIPNKYTDEEARQVYDRVEKIITDNGGQVTFNEYWGKKRLAYEIKHNSFGYYGLFEFDLERENLAKLDSLLRLSNEVLRHQIVSKKTKSAVEIAKNEAIQAKIDSKKAIKAAAEKENAGKKKEAAPTESVSKPTDRRAELKDLDKKLENILNAEDLI